MKNKNKYKKIIDQIEAQRKKNNINWMNILRIAMKNSPVKTKKVLENINKNDKKISKLLAYLVSKNDSSK